MYEILIAADPRAVFTDVALVYGDALYRPACDVQA